MLESKIERYLRDEIKKIGGLAYKLVNLSRNGFPDRTVFLPSGEIYFVETKQKGEKATALQKFAHRELEKLGHKVYVLDTKQKIDDFIKEVSKI